MLDVAGKEIEVGMSVAFCTAGRSSDMRLGKVVRMTKKQVEIEYTDYKYSYEARGTVGYQTTCLRNAENVAIV